MNQQFGRYRIDMELGRGAMGVVYKAFDTVLEREVAIKTIASSIRDDHLKERFIREARAAGKLLHPNIITIYDFGVYEDQLFISMEYVEGTDLFDLINSRPALDVRRRLECVRQICLGLDFAHAHGVFHRDVKPANIRLDTKGQVKIVDFGLAIIQTSSLTRSSAILGTPSYIAPERLLGGQSDARSDQFAVGIILFELLSYSKAFKGDNLSLVIHNILHRDPPRLDNAFVARYPELNAILLRSIQKNPQNRFASMGEMACDLERVCKRMADERFSMTEAIAVDEHVVDSKNFMAQTELVTASQPATFLKNKSEKRFRTGRKTVFRLVLALILLLSGLAVAYFFRQGREGGVPTGTLIFDVRPYALVSGITRIEENRSVLLESILFPLTTPLRLQLPPGRYQVNYDHPEWGGASRVIELELVSGEIIRASDYLGESFIKEALRHYELPLGLGSLEEK